MKEHISNISLKWLMYVVHLIYFLLKNCGYLPKF